MTDSPVLAFAFLTICSSAIFYVLGFNLGEEGLQAEATKTECAQFNPQSGKFEWIKDD